MTVRTLDAVTIDFHNTLFQCDEWFQLEVETLVPSLLHWIEERHGVGTSQEQREELRRAYRALRRHIIAEGIERDASACVLAACEACELQLDPECVDEGIAELMRAALSTAAPMPGATAAVAELRRRELRLAVISNAIYHPFLLWALEAHGFGDAFQVITTSASSGYYKSHPGIYQRTVAELDVAPARALHVGDSYEFDVLGAARAGLRTALVSAADPAPGPAAPDIVIRSLEELVAAVDTIDAGDVMCHAGGPGAD